jgi:hypothetical protein
MATRGKLGASEEISDLLEWKHRIAVRDSSGGRLRRRALSIQQNSPDFLLEERFLSVVRRQARAPYWCQLGAEGPDTG